jgi:hypothetical protein
LEFTYIDSKDIPEDIKVGMEGNCNIIMGKITD